MSELGIISRQYKDISTLFKTVNRSVILLKKCYYELPGSEDIPEQEVYEARQVLASVVSLLVAKITSHAAVHEKVLVTHVNRTTQTVYANEENESGDEEPESGGSISILEEIEPPYIPPSFVRHLWKKHSRDISMYVEDLRVLSDALYQDQPLTDEFMEQLSRLCLELDTEAASIYWNLRRT